MAGDRFGRNVENARLGRKNEKPVLRERPAGGSQSVSVERGAESDSVGERHRRRSVPRFHERGMVFVERPDVVPHVVLRAPRLRNQHHHRVRRVAPGGDKQFEDVVQRRRVGLSSVHDRQHLLQFVAEHRRRKRRLAGGERVEVALYRVYLAVVRDCAEWVGKLPRRERVGRISLVYDRERGDEIRIGQVGIELFDLRREKETFVDDRPRRAGADVGVLGGFLDLAADDVEAALVRAIDEHLPYPRHRGAGVASDGVRIHRHVAPSDRVASFAADRVFDFRFFAFAPENHRHRERWRRLGDQLCKKGVRNFEEEAGAVAGLRVVSGRAAVHEAFQDRHALFHDVVARHAVEVRHHADAARIVFVFVAIQSLLQFPDFAPVSRALLCRTVDVVYLLHIICNIAQPVPMV